MLDNVAPLNKGAPKRTLPYDAPMSDLPQAEGLPSMGVRSPDRPCVHSLHRGLFEVRPGCSRVPVNRAHQIQKGAGELR